LTDEGYHQSNPNTLADFITDPDEVRFYPEKDKSGKQLPNPYQWEGRQGYIFPKAPLSKWRVKDREAFMEAVANNNLRARWLGTASTTTHQAHSSGSVAVQPDLPATSFSASPANYLEAARAIRHQDRLMDKAEDKEQFNRTKIEYKDQMNKKDQKAMDQESVTTEHTATEAFYKRKSERTVRRSLRREKRKLGISVSPWASEDEESASELEDGEDDEE
jgi:hypothetical protein